MWQDEAPGGAWATTGHHYKLRGSGPLSYDPAFKLAHHDYKLRGHGYDVVYPNDISPDDDNGEA